MALMLTTGLGTTTPLITKAAANILKIDKDADIGLALYGIKAEQTARVQQQLGINREIIQETIASEAYGDAKSYEKYLVSKESRLNSVRSEVVMYYSRIFNEFMALGYPKSQAKAKANEATEIHKKLKMEQFYTMYPNSGQKAQKLL